eukprot:g2001.t1
MASFFTMAADSNNEAMNHNDVGTGGSTEETGLTSSSFAENGNGEHHPATSSLQNQGVGDKQQVKDDDKDKDTSGDFNWNAKTCAIRVATRMRPLNTLEREAKQKYAWNIAHSGTKNTANNAASNDTTINHNGESSSSSPSPLKKHQQRNKKKKKQPWMPFSIMRPSPALEKMLANRGVEKQPKGMLSLHRKRSTNSSSSSSHSGANDHDEKEKNTHRYKFQKHSCFGPESDNQEIYDKIGKPIVEGAMQGINGTIFAYGQTSSGKTHTVMGGGTDPGLIVLSTIDVFRTIAETPSTEFLLRISICEIYNEVIKDLLNPHAKGVNGKPKRLQVRSHKTRGIVISGLTEEIVTSVEQVLELIEIGIANRAIGETKMNKGSSRSHTIFRMTVESKPAFGEENIPTAAHEPQQPEYMAASKKPTKRRKRKGTVRVSTLNIVDLAGSERTNDAGTGGSGKRFKEGVNINKSLLTLGRVIEKLAQKAAVEASMTDVAGGDESMSNEIESSSTNPSAKVHVPFRNSKLTRILEPSLGGNARTAVVCTVSPLVDHAEMSMGTLRFARRAVCVRNRAKVNRVDMSKAMMGQHKEKISELRNKIEQCSLLSSNNGGPNASGGSSSGQCITSEHGSQDGYITTRDANGVLTTRDANGNVVQVQNGGVLTTEKKKLDEEREHLQAKEEEVAKLKNTLQMQEKALKTEKDNIEEQRKALEQQLTKLTTLVLNSKTIRSDKKALAPKVRSKKNHRLSIGIAGMEGTRKGLQERDEWKELRSRRETWCPGFWGKALQVPDSAHMDLLEEEEDEDIDVLSSDDDGLSSTDGTKSNKRLLSSDGGIVDITANVVGTKIIDLDSNSTHVDFRGVQVSKLRKMTKALREDLAVARSRSESLEQIVQELTIRVNRAEGNSYEAFKGLSAEELGELEQFHLSALARIAEAKLIEAYQRKFNEREMSLRKELEMYKDRALIAETSLEEKSISLEETEEKLQKLERRISMEARRHRQESLQMEINIRNFHAKQVHQQQGIALEQQGIALSPSQVPLPLATTTEGSIEQQERGSSSKSSLIAGGLSRITPSSSPLMKMKTNTTSTTTNNVGEVMSDSSMIKDERKKVVIGTPTQKNKKPVGTPTLSSHKNHHRNVKGEKTKKTIYIKSEKGVKQNSSQTKTSLPGFNHNNGNGHSGKVQQHGSGLVRTPKLRRSVSQPSKMRTPSRIRTPSSGRRHHQGSTKRKITVGGGTKVSSLQQKTKHLSSHSKGKLGGGDKENANHNLKGSAVETSQSGPSSALKRLFDEVTSPQ